MPFDANMNVRSYNQTYGPPKRPSLSRSASSSSVDSFSSTATTIPTMQDSLEITPPTSVESPGQLIKRPPCEIADFRAFGRKTIAKHQCGASTVNLYTLRFGDFHFHNDRDAISHATTPAAPNRIRRKRTRAKRIKETEEKVYAATWTGRLLWTIDKVQPYAKSLLDFIVSTWARINFGIGFRFV